MRIFFVMRNLMYLRNYGRAIEELARRGHDVVVGYEDTPGKSPPEIQEAAQELSARSPRIQLREVPRRADFWEPLSNQLGVMRDYTRYFHPRYAKASRCADRCGSMLYPGVRRRFTAYLAGKPARADRVGASLQRLASIVPEDREIAHEIESVAPNLLLVTPLIDFGSAQTDYVIAAQRRGIPTVLCVASWDNLTNKGLMPVLPDRVLVWNKEQEQEAIELHEVPPERIVVTGAQLFDDWFQRKPSSSGETFKRAIGLDPDQPYILYTCSSIFIAKTESTFLRRWLAALRASADVNLRKVGVVIRPHPGSPKCATQWDDPQLKEFDNVVVYPRSGGYPVTEQLRQLYFDSLAHASCVVGINTSAILEAAIAGRRSYSVRDEEHEQAQEGMLHFAHLTRYGFVTLAGSLEEHLTQLSRAVTGNGANEGLRAGVETFLRPGGITKPATPAFVAAVEEAGRARRQRVPRRATLSQGVARLALAPFALSLQALSGQRTGKKWVPQHPVMRSIERAVSPSQSDNSANLWYKIRRYRRRTGRFLSVLVLIPLEYSPGRSFHDIKEAALKRVRPHAEDDEDERRGDEVSNVAAKAKDC